MLKEAFTREAREQVDNLHESPRKEAKEKDVKSKKEDFNACAWIAEQLSGKFWRCALSGRVYRTDDNTELTGTQAKTLCFNMKMKASIRQEDFWLYFEGDYIEERNVIKLFFEGLEDPTHDFMTLYFDSLILCEQSQYSILQSVFRKWLIGAVAMLQEKQFFPNVLCPVLISEIDKGKTSFFKRLTFATDLHQYSTVHRFTGGGGLDKDTQSLFASCFLVCIDDLDKTDFRKSSAFRSLISAEKFYHRPPYGKIERLRDRIASLCGTTNEKDIISDPQNNRRIVPIEIDKIDFERMNSVTPSQIWASAYSAYKAGEAWTLESNEVAFIQGISTKYTPTAGWGDFILQYIVPCEKGKTAMFATSTELYMNLVAPDPILSKSFSLDKFAHTLKECGFIYASKRVEGKPHPIKGYYYRPA